MAICTLTGMKAIIPFETKIEGEGGVKLSPQNTPVEWTVEESWFFRLSKYQEPLLKLYADQPGWIRPDSRRNETIKFVEGGLRDLSVSRTSFDWGVKVPDGGGHVMYVWLDALTTYISGIGFPDETDEWKKFWPANLHLIGKDIVRFHAVYWPALLLAAGLPLVLAENYGVDQLRYFFMREVSFGQDGSWSEEAIVTRCNAELANSFGNLAQRVLSMIYKNCDGELTIGEQNQADADLYTAVSTAVCRDMMGAFADLQFTQGLEAWLRAVFACNQYVDEQAPWALKKTDPDRMAIVLTTLFQMIRHLAIAIQPVVPDASARLLYQMGIPENQRNFSNIIDTDWLVRLVQSGYKVQQPVGIFPRLEIPMEEDA
jgi:methionyl-tRNA synthetase